MSQSAPKLGLSEAGTNLPPISPRLRFVAWLLRAEGVLDDAFADEVAARADSAAAELRAACIALPDPEPLSLFDDVYAEPNPMIERERDDLARYLAMFEEDAR